MNKNLIIAIVIALPVFTMGQERHLLDQEIMQREQTFKVIGATAAETTKVQKFDNFNLQPFEKKAVARIGNSITRLDARQAYSIRDITTEKDVFMLPEIYFAKVKDSQEQIKYTILFIDSSPLRFDFARGLFEGLIRMIPIELISGGSGEPVQKDLEVPEEIIISHGAESMKMDIKSVNWPPMDITLTEQEPRDSVIVKVLTMSNPAGYSKSIKVEPAIVLTSARKKIQGFGVQTLPLHISLKGVSSYDNIGVSIEPSLGSVSPNSLVLSNDQPGEVTLRSESTGTIEVHAVSQNYRSNSISVEAIFPWLFLLLAIAGGVIGSVGRKLTKKEKLTFRAFIVGGIVGLIAAVAYAGLGLNLANISISTQGINEAIVFGIGLIAGYYGLKGADALAGK